MSEVAAAPAADGHRHRRTYLVDRAFQLKYALLMAAAGVVLSLAFGLWLHQAHGQAMNLAALDPELRAVMERGEQELLLAFAGIAALMAVALGLLGIVITHRVAGPIFVMGHYMNVVAQGRFPRMRTLRRGDELRPFFETFLAAVEALKRREAHHAVLLADAAVRLRASADPALAGVADALDAAAAERRLAVSADDPEPTPLFTPAPARERAS
jgi:hypothetical protein